jgi:hypothetical protein
MGMRLVPVGQGEGLSEQSRIAITEAGRDDAQIDPVGIRAHKSGSFLLGHDDGDESCSRGFPRCWLERFPQVQSQDSLAGWVCLFQRRTLCGRKENKSILGHPSTTARQRQDARGLSRPQLVEELGVRSCHTVSVGGVPRKRETAVEIVGHGTHSI